MSQFMSLTEGPVSIKGIVLGVRNHGGIIFIRLCMGVSTYDLVGTKESMDSKDYARLRAVHVGDFLYLSCKHSANEVHIIRVVDTYVRNCHIEPKVFQGRRTILLAMSLLLSRIRSFLADHSYLEVRLPSIHFGEGRGASFPIDFFGQNSRLSASNALFLSVATAQVGNCYSIQRVFRAEPSDTSKHLAEFDMLEVAMLGDCLDRLEDVLQELLIYVITSEWPPEIACLLPREVQELPRSIRRVEYSDISATYGLSGRGLGKYEKKIASEGPIFVRNFPSDVATWAAKSSSDGRAKSFNMLLTGVGEVAEGSERNTDLDALSARFMAAGLSKQLGWYVNGLAYPMGTISVCGLGLERLAMWLFGLSNIRDATFFYRDKKFSEITEC